MVHDHSILAWGEHTPCLATFRKQWGHHHHPLMAKTPGSRILSPQAHNFLLIPVAFAWTAIARFEARPRCGFFGIMLHILLLYLHAVISLEEVIFQYTWCTNPRSIAVLLVYVLSDETQNHRLFLAKHTDIRHV